MSSASQQDSGRRPDGGGSDTVTIDPPEPERTSEGFFSYLSHYRRGSPRWDDLAQAFTEIRRSGGSLPSRFKTEQVIEAITTLGPDGTGKYTESEITDLLSTLLQVETEWRLDLVVRHRRHAKDIAGEAARSWAVGSPEESFTIRCRYVPPGSTKACGRGTIPGTSRCRDHGGVLVDEKTRRAVLMGAYLGLVDATDQAVSTLVDVAQNGRNELARVQAARELLDRAGLTAELNVTVRIEGDERTSRIEALQTRLDTMSDSLRHRVAGAIEASASESSDEHVTVASEQQPSDQGEQPQPEP